MAVHPTMEDILPLAIINIVINCHYINILTIGLMSTPQDGQLTQVLTVAQIESSICLRSHFMSQMGLSENSVPLHPMVNDHYPY